MEIEDYAGHTPRKPAGVCSKSEMSIEHVDSFTLQAEFHYLVVFTVGLLSPRNQYEGPRMFNAVYTVFTYSNVIKEMK